VIRLLALVPVLLLLASPALAGDTSGVRLRLELGQATSAEIRVRVTQGQTLILGGAVQIDGGPEHSGEVTFDLGPALDIVELELTEFIKTAKVGASALVVLAEQAIRADNLALPPKASGTRRPSWPQAPQIIWGLTTHPAASGSFASWAGPELFYTLSYENPRVDRDWRWGSLAETTSFERSIRQEWNRVGQFMKVRGLTCRPGHRFEGTLHIFAISLASLNTSKTRSRAEEVLGRPLRGLWGYYEPSLLNSTEAALAVSPVNTNTSTSKSILGHELAHHAYTGCHLSSRWKGGSESFAQAFEAWAY
jgi:hypothetical protein